MTMIVTRNRAAGLVLFAVIVAGFAAAAAAEVRLPAVFSDHMVIQQEKPISIWGWAGRGEEVTVRLAGREQKARAGGDGKWRVAFNPLKAGSTPLQLTVRGAKDGEVVVDDILVGEVWVCSGQSNMEWSMLAIASPTPEILRADDAELRLFQVPRRTSDRPEDDVDAKWTLTTPETVRRFSAVAFYFGSELRHALGVPVGLVMSAWGGTAIEPWTPAAGFAAVPEVQPILAETERQIADYRRDLAQVLPSWEAWVRESRKSAAAGAELPRRPTLPVHPLDNPQAPTALYNGMIHPLIGLAIRGAIWYQGESNRNDGLFYEKKMEALIRGWREVWQVGDFAFYYVQLAPYNYAYGRETPTVDIPDFLRLPLIWEAQANILRLPNTGMAVVTDITDLNDIHPRNKKDVGARLSLWARANIYGESGLVYSGPLFKSMSVEGGRARIAFDHVGG
ncbi:MAG: sialate O-acetylesterase, partial [Candidatus Aminicenantes bacterium]|nr:sialate O-acetylesterase [Candidatus Aminicenantes bacterium]